MKTKVYLYWAEEEKINLVGFSSLGVTKWEIPEGTEKQKALHIPWLGVGHQYHGQGDADGKYSNQIIDDLIAESVSREDFNYLTLMVDRGNLKAMALYRKAGFELFESKKWADDENASECVGMVLDLKRTRMALAGS